MRVGSIGRELPPSTASPAAICRPGNGLGSNDVTLFISCVENEYTRRSVAYSDPQDLRDNNNGRTRDHGFKRALKPISIYQTVKLSAKQPGFIPRSVDPSGYASTRSLGHALDAGGDAPEDAYSMGQTGNSALLHASEA